MKLYIVGPAFGWPSIDPQCNAAVALLRVWERQTGQQWELLCASHGFDSLPMLEDNGGKRHHGFRSIAAFLDQEKAGGRASGAENGLEAFVEANGQLLIDVAYYVSYENYSGNTRPAFTKVLPWLANYIVPPKRRAAARKRTEHLGVSGLDMDDIHESVLDDPEHSKSNADKSFDTTTQSRASILLGRKKTIKSMLQQREYSGAFRLKNLADSFFEPLNEALSDGAVLGKSEKEPTAAACLAFGYLSLLSNQKLVQPWISDIMATQYGDLKDLVDEFASQLNLRVAPDMAETLFSADTIPKADSPDALPWTLPVKPTIMESISVGGKALIMQLPSTPAPAAVCSSKGSIQRKLLRDYFPQTAFSAITAMALTGYLMFKSSYWPQGEQVHFFGRRSLANFGAAGAVFSALGSLR